MRENLIRSLVLKISGIGAGIIGLVASFVWNMFEHGWWWSLLFYTMQSNIWLIVIQTIFLVDTLRVISGRSSFINERWRKAKYVFVSAIMLTFTVFGFLLVPALPLSYTFSLTSLTLHFIAPLLAVADFILDDHQLVLRKRDMVLTAIPPVFYLSFVFVCVISGITFPPDGALVPYFFLDYARFGWFRIGPNGLGVVYWAIIIFALMFVISYALRSVITKIRVKKMNID